MKRLLWFSFFFTLISLVCNTSPRAQAAEEQPEKRSSPEKKVQRTFGQEESLGADAENIEAFSVGEVVVRSRRIANIENATTTTILEAEDIEAHGDRDLSDTFLLVPGLTTYQHGKGHMRFRLRGFEMPYVALLVDGIPIADVYEANVDISKIPVMNVSEIIINRGSCSALYGTMGTVGSVNIITKRPTGIYAKTQLEYGINEDYTINMAQGNVIGNFYYWVTGTVAKQNPFEVSNFLTKSKRRKWFDKFFPELGYTSNPSSAQETYLNDTGEWPHQEAFKYNIAAKAGYTFLDGVESGINANYAQGEAARYSLSLSNIEEYGYNRRAGAIQWTEPDYTLGSGAFSWRDTYNINVSPYIDLQLGNFDAKANVFYIYNYEYLDGYADADETTAIRGWGGAHSNWNNTSVGFNILPSYRIAKWNRLNMSILFRWDRHRERQQADPQFIASESSAVGLRSYNYAGYGWFTTKLMTGEQLTIAVEDEISLTKAVNVPINISAGISYDAQILDTYKLRPTVDAEDPTLSSYGKLVDQYKAKNDSLILGTRDSFNPVVGVTSEPFKDLLILRASYAQKTRLPTLSQYSAITDSATDTGLDPEKSHNTNAGFELLFLSRTLSFRADYFFSRFKDKIATIYDMNVPSLKTYTNIEGEDHQGLEVISDTQFRRIGGIVDLDLSFFYTYLVVRNLDSKVADSSINKGEMLADIPAHQVGVDLRLDFVSKTSVNIFGSFQANAIKYAMKSNPDNATESFSTSFYKTVQLHNPVMLNVKISQKFLDHFEIYALCRNIVDDYSADPFNPGPGRQFYFGVAAKI